MCGGHSNASANGSCPESKCGGAGCRDEKGNRVCGGKGCNGTVSASLAAIGYARNVTKSLNTANEEIQGVAKKVTMCCADNCVGVIQDDLTSYCVSASGFSFSDSRCEESGYDYPTKSTEKEGPL